MILDLMLPTRALHQMRTVIQPPLILPNVPALLPAALHPLLPLLLQQPNKPLPLPLLMLLMPRLLLALLHPRIVRLLPSMIIHIVHLLPLSTNRNRIPILILMLLVL